MCASDPFWLFHALLTPSWNSSKNVCTTSSKDTAVVSKPGEIWQAGIPEVHVPLHRDAHCTSVADFGLALRQTANCNPATDLLLRVQRAFPWVS